MYSDKRIEELIAELEQCSALDDVKIIKAFPYAIKPTVPDKAMITLSPGEVSCESIGIGEDCFHGRYGIDANVFVPYEMGSSVMADILSRLLQNSVDCRVQGVSVKPAQADDTLHCYTAGCTLTYYDKFDFGDGIHE